MMKLTRAGMIEHGDCGKLLWTGQIAEVSRRGGSLSPFLSDMKEPKHLKICEQILSDKVKDF